MIHIGIFESNDAMKRKQAVLADKLLKRNTGCKGQCCSSRTFI